MVCVGMDPATLLPRPAARRDLSVSARAPPRPQLGATCDSEGPPPGSRELCGPGSRGSQPEQSDSESEGSGAGGLFTGKVAARFPLTVVSRPPVADRQGPRTSWRAADPSPPPHPAHPVHRLSRAAAAHCGSSAEEIGRHGLCGVGADLGERGLQGGRGAWTVYAGHIASAMVNESGKRHGKNHSQVEKLSGWG
eukprot:351163-Chlamydomonas_euryale.AAC.3